jgi:hypothetical protein
LSLKVFATFFQISFYDRVPDPVRLHLKHINTPPSSFSLSPSSVAFFCSLKIAAAHAMECGLPRLFKKRIEDCDVWQRDVVPRVILSKRPAALQAPKRKAGSYTRMSGVAQKLSNTQYLVFRTRCAYTPSIQRLLTVFCSLSSTIPFLLIVIKETTRKTTWSLGFFVSPKRSSRSLMSGNELSCFIIFLLRRLASSQADGQQSAKPGCMTCDPVVVERSCWVFGICRNTQNHILSAHSLRVPNNDSTFLPYGRRRVVQNSGSTSDHKMHICV